MLQSVETCSLLVVKSESCIPFGVLESTVTHKSSMLWAAVDFCGLPWLAFSPDDAIGTLPWYSLEANLPADLPNGWSLVAALVPVSLV